MYVLEQGNVDYHLDLQFINNEIHKDYNNYSAWHHRSVVYSKLRNDEIIPLFKVDFELLLNAFYVEPDDQTSWVYYRWLLSECVKRYKEMNKVYECIELIKEQFNQINELNQYELNEHNKHIKWIMLMLIQIHIVINKLDNTITLLNNETIHDYIDWLKKVDTQRSGYYQFIQNNINELSFIH